MTFAWLLVEAMLESALEVPSFPAYSHISDNGFVESLGTRKGLSRYSGIVHGVREWNRCVVRPVGTLAAMTLLKFYLYQVN